MKQLILSALAVVASLGAVSPANADYYSSNYYGGQRTYTYSPGRYSGNYGGPSVGLVGGVPCFPGLCQLFGGGSPKPKVGRPWLFPDCSTRTLVNKKTGEWKIMIESKGGDCTDKAGPIG